MTFAIMILACIIWGLICRDNNASTTTVVLGALTISLITTLIEKSV